MTLAKDYEDALSVYGDYVDEAYIHLEQQAQPISKVSDLFTKRTQLQNVPEQLRILQEIVQNNSYFISDHTKSNDLELGAQKPSPVLICLYHDLGRDRANLKETLKDVIEKIGAPERIITTSYLPSCHTGTVIALRQNPHAFSGVQQSVLEQQNEPDLTFTHATNSVQEPWYELWNLLKEKNILVKYAGTPDMHLLPKQHSALRKLACPRGQPKNLLELLNEMRASFTEHLFYRTEIEKRIKEFDNLKSEVASQSKKALASIVLELNNGLYPDTDKKFKKIAILPVDLWIYYSTLDDTQRIKTNYTTLIPLSLGKRMHVLTKEVEAKEYLKALMFFAKKLAKLKGEQTPEIES